jgi:hypothetical protein
VCAHSPVLATSRSLHNKDGSLPSGKNLTSILEEFLTVLWDDKQKAKKIAHDNKKKDPTKEFKE